MPLINYIKDYWVQISFVCTLLFGAYKFAMAMIEATKCSLRNDILEIYDQCKNEKKITKWQLSAIKMSYEQYKKLKGNSFVDELVKKVDTFEIID
ncbi:MAG: hypothetical protein IKE01_06685 [Clostridia bacterium]|nr:hypothetical protein [Clostridia bacterium]